MDSAMLMNISDQQIDDALNDESGERVGKLNKAIKKLDAEERALISLFYNDMFSLLQSSAIGVKSAPSMPISKVIPVTLNFFG